MNRLEDIEIERDRKKKTENKTTRHVGGTVGKKE